MHPPAFEYVARAAENYVPGPPLRVVEFGSRDVNGTVRPLFPGADYHGIDVRDGRGVDQVLDAANFTGRHYDVVVCSETLEHAPNAEAVIRSARRALKTGGVLILTIAAPERAPHNVNGDPWTPGSEHYEGIHPDRLRAWLKKGWETLSFVHTPEIGDLYATARKTR